MTRGAKASTSDPGIGAVLSAKRHAAVSPSYAVAAHVADLTAMPISVSGSRRLSSRSERANLDPFAALAGDIAFRDQRDLMERPFFSLAKTKRLTSIPYRAGNTEVQVYAVPGHGMATIWDAAVLIWAAAHLVKAADRGLPTSRFFRRRT